MVACWRNTQIFNLVDKDGGGTISKEELGELMETLGINASQEEIDQMIAEIVRRCSCNALPRPVPEPLCCGNCLCRTKITMAKLILMVRELLPLSCAVRQWPSLPCIRICRGDVKESECQLHIGGGQTCIQGNAVIALGGLKPLQSLISMPLGLPNADL